MPVAVAIERQKPWIEEEEDEVEWNEKVVVVFFVFFIASF